MVTLSNKSDFYPSDAMLARVYAVAFLSICLSVCVSHTCFVSKWLNSSLKFFYHGHSLLNSDGVTPNRGTEYKAESENWVISILTNMSVHLGNGARYGHSCYKSLIGNHVHATEWCHLQ